MLEPGSELAGYRIERLIARGGMGEVYEATQLSLDRRVALKLISEPLGADDSFRARFRREARLAAAIDHPSILPVYEAGELPGGRLFLAMRFVRGQDLSSLLKERGRLEPREMVEILRPIGDALDAAHERGLIHRDVKPANVMLEPTDSGRRAFLTDFGLAKPHADVSEHTATGVVLGTIDYMAPEQASGGPLDGRADVYSFGCMVYQCLTGEVPYRRDTPTATLIAHANAPVPLPSAANPALPRSLDLVVQRAMAKDPEKRARSAGALMRWVSGQLDALTPPGRPVIAKSPPPGTRIMPGMAPDEAPTHRRRRPARWLVAVGIVAIGVLAAILALEGGAAKQSSGRQVASKPGPSTPKTSPSPSSTGTAPTGGAPASTTPPPTTTGPPLGPELTASQLSPAVVPQSALQRVLPGFYPSLDQDSSAYALHGGIPKPDLCSAPLSTPLPGSDYSTAYDAIPYGVRPTIFFGSDAASFAGQGALQFMNTVSKDALACGWQSFFGPRLDDQVVRLTQDEQSPDGDSLHDDLIFVRERSCVIEVASATASGTHESDANSLAAGAARQLAMVVGSA